MIKTYFTMGQVHVHHIDGQTIDKDCVVCLSGESHGENRERAYDLFEGKFAFQYNEKPDMSYFPRGIIEL